MKAFNRKKVFNFFEWYNFTSKLDKELHSKKGEKEQNSDKKYLNPRN